MVGLVCSMHLHGKTKGFTLVELIVVIGLIMVILTIVLASMAQARQNSREKQRVADLANIEFALTLYNEKNREYPSFDNGIEIGMGGELDDDILQLNGNTYSDPKRTDGDDTYSYWYDSNFTCYELSQKVLFVRNMELTKNANFDEVCTHASPDTTVAGSGSYIVVLKQ